MLVKLYRKSNAKKMASMKSASLPSLRVKPELRSAAESVLREGETLSGFIEDSIRSNIDRRQNQKEFITRGLLSRDKAKETGEYLSDEEVVTGLGEMLAKAKQQTKH
jgi:predicted transcriptional regulator